MRDLKTPIKDVLAKSLARSKAGRMMQDVAAETRRSRNTSDAPLDRSTLFVIVIAILGMRMESFSNRTSDGSPWRWPRCSPPWQP